MISSFLKTDEGWSTLIDGKNPDSPQIWNVHKGEKVPCYLHLNTLKVGVEPSDNIRTATMNAAAFLESFFERLASEMGKKRVDAGSSFTAGPAQSKPSTESPDKAGSVVDKASAGSPLWLARSVNGLRVRFRRVTTSRICHIIQNGKCVER